MVPFQPSDKNRPRQFFLLIHSTWRQEWEMEFNSPQHNAVTISRGLTVCNKGDRIGRQNAIVKMSMCFIMDALKVICSPFFFFFFHFSNRWQEKTASTEDLRTEQKWSGNRETQHCKADKNLHTKSSPALSKQMTQFNFLLKKSLCITLRTSASENI